VVAEYEQILEKLEAIGTAVASLQESIGLLMEALQPSPDADPAPMRPRIATYTQMYGPITAAPVVTPGAVSPPRMPARRGLWRWLTRDVL
jgi:hypothetical protein